MHTYSETKTAIDEFGNILEPRVQRKIEIPVPSDSDRYVLKMDNSIELVLKADEILKNIPTGAPLGLIGIKDP